MSESKTHREIFAEQIKVAQRPFVGDLSRAKWAAEQLRLQNEQVPTLIAAERMFVEATRAAPRLRRLILEQLLASVEERGRTAAARAYFRERNVVFVRQVLPTISAGDWNALDSFAMNWAYVAWAWRFVEVSPERAGRLAAALNGSALPPAEVRLREGRRGGVPEPVVAAMLETTETIAKIRHALVVTNLQLIVDRAKTFDAATPSTSQADVMDHIGTAAEGTLAGIDKMMLEAHPMPHWAPSWHPVEGFVYWRGESAAGAGEPFEMPQFAQSGYRVDGHHTADKHQPKVRRPECPASVFRTTTIGRMGGRLIQTYSQTHMHLGPADKRLLYQANKVAAEYSESGTPDYAGMSERIVLDRILWNFARAAGVEVREIAAPIVAAARADGLEAAIQLLAKTKAPPTPRRSPTEDDQSWAAKVRTREAAWPLAGQSLPKLLADWRKRAPTPDEVAEIMGWNSTVPVVSDEGNDRLVEGGAYAGPRSSEPDAALERRERDLEVSRGLAQLGLLERKLLVLLGLAPLECVLPEATVSA